MIALLVTFLISVVTALLGVWIVDRSPKWLSEERVNQIFVIGAGLLLAIAFLEFLPHAMGNGNSASGLWILIGIVFVYLSEVYITPKLSVIDRWAFKSEHPGYHDHYGKEDTSHCAHGHHSSSLKASDGPVIHHTHVVSPSAACSAVGCLIICTFFDGVEIASAFFLSEKTGYFTSFGLLLHILPDGILVASLGLRSGLSKGFTRLLTWTVGLSLFVGAGVAIALEHVSRTPFLIPFATGVLIYVGFLHLFPVVGKTRFGTLLFVLSLTIYGLLMTTIHVHH